MKNDLQAIDFLVKKEPLFAPVMEQFGVYELKPDDELTLFQAVSRTIIYQQLAGKAASSIHQKFRALFEKDDPTAEQTAAMSTDLLQSAGLSNSKVNAVKHLSECVLDGSLPSTAVIKELPDAEIVEILLQVKGVGPWTANIALMFWLGRPDVFPVNDLGLKKGIQKMYQLPDLPSEQEAEKYASAWQPYRTYASWYLWRILEL